VTVLPIINPLSTARVFAGTVGACRALAAPLARRVAINSGFVPVGSMLIGSCMPELFGISLPVVRIGGGLPVAATGWRMPSRSEEDDAHAAALEKVSTLFDAQIVRQSFLPITFPLATGPGTIAASIALGARIRSRPLVRVPAAGRG
jgi:multiple antibiotic resistance protein